MAFTPPASGGSLGAGIDISELEDPTVKGDLIVGDGTGGPSALTAGANDTLLIADSGEATGLKWSNTLATVDIDGGSVDGAIIGAAAAANVTSKILSVTPDAITSSGTNDVSLSIAQTLNDSGAPGGSDNYIGLLLNVTETDVTGWNNVGIFDFQIGNASIFAMNNTGTLVLHQKGGTPGTNNTTIQNDGTTTSFGMGAGAGGFKFSPATVTSSSTADKGLQIAQTLNDPGASGGNDTYTGLFMNLTETDTTGWDNRFLMDLQVDGKSAFQIDHVNAGINLSDRGVGNFQIAVNDQNPGGDDAGAALQLQGGAAGGNTTGDAGGNVNIIGGAAAGSGNNDGGSLLFIGGTATGSGNPGLFGIIQPGGTPGTDQVAIAHDGQDAQFINLDSTGGFTFQDASFNEIFFGDSAGFAITQQIQTTGSPNALLVTGAAHTTLTASTEAVGVDLDLSATVQFATGALATQRAIRVLAPTYGFVGASTLTDAATLYIDKAPVAGTNATITNAYSVWVDAGVSRFDGRVLEAQGADVASGTNITLGADGNTFEITGTTKVDLISNIGWTEGSSVTLIANESVTIDSGTATSSTNVTIKLAGGVDFAMTADDTLTLKLSSTTAGGQAWREITRSAN
jgi:hypothetical protein